MGPFHVGERSGDIWKIMAVQITTYNIRDEVQLESQIGRDIISHEYLKRFPQAISIGSLFPYRNIYSFNK